MSATGSSDFLTGSVMSERIRAFDWSSTPVGPIAKWPQSLKTALRIALNSRYPTWLGWGWELTNFYNDPYVPVLGKRDEWALGASARDVWREIWEEHLGPQADAVLLRGEASWNDQRQMVMYRNGYAEETYFTFSFSPLPADEGGVGGLFCACTEDTQKVLGERRLAALRHLAGAAGDARTEADACGVIARTLAEHASDVAFSLIYLLDEGGVSARLAGCTEGLGDRYAPPLVTMADPTPPWPLAAVLAGGTQIVTGLDAALGLPGGVWPEPATTVAVLPLARPGQLQPRGFLVVGASPRLPFDHNYESFFELLARGIASALANVRAYEDERKRAEALAELDRTKTAFFSNVSHEFRTPLTLLLGPVEDLLARRTADVSPEARGELEIVHRNGLRLLKLVNALLDFSRLEAGRMQAVYAPTDLAAVTAEVASVFRSAVERAGLKLVVECPPLPEPVHVDRDMWEKIVLNLVSNAFKFTFEGEIDVRLRAREEAAELTVRDTGIGIAADQLPSVFTRFHRVPGARSRTHEGTGIGLALVQELVKLHGGTVAATSEPGRGTAFTVTLPFGVRHLPAERVMPGRLTAARPQTAAPFVEEALRWLPESLDAAYAATGDHAPRRPQIRILLADDNADMRDYVRRLLGRLWTVEAVADGHAALAAARANVPSLVLTDIMMPGLDGFELLRELRADARTRTVPVILLSARAGEESRIEGLDAGADDYLVKPFTARELVARVNAHLAMADVRREAAQRETELRDRLESVLASIREQFFALDREWRYTYVNDRVVELTGTPREHLLGRSVWELFPESRDTAFGREVRRAAETQVAAHFEYRSPRFGCWFETYVYPSTDGVTVFVADVTERKRAEEALRDADRAKDEFLAMLGHELRNPLGALASAVRVLDLAGPDSANAPRAVGVIRRQIEHLTRMVDDLLDLSRVTTGRVRLSRRVLDVAEVVTGAVHLLRLRGALERHRVTVETQPVWADADETRLEQIVTNLVGNAARYTPAGGDIEVRVHREHETGVIAVRDTGIGIPHGMQERIFDLFIQGDRASDRAQGGLGIGLTLVRRLVELHAGTIEVRSDGAGRGSVFTVRIPATTTAPTQPPATPPAPVGPGTPRRVLVVEDNDDAREALATALRLLGFQVHEAPDGPTGVEAMAAVDADAALVDIGLPGLDGYGVAEAIRATERGRHAYLVALTGYGQPEDHRRALDAGFDAHVVKPVDPVRLEAILRSMTARSTGA